MVRLTDRVTLGLTEIGVSRLCLGAMMFGEATDEAEARRIIDDAAGRGVNFIDTANVYNAGRSEEIVGRAVRENRSHWIVATKVGFREDRAVKDPSVREEDLSRPQIMHHVDASLQRLGLDHVDIYYTHVPDPTTPWPDVVQTMGLLMKSGKILHWGLSNVRGWEIAHIVHICRAQGVTQPCVVQPYYNLMNRQPEVDLLPAAHHFSLGVVPYSPLARGILTGKYQAGTAPEAATRAGRG